jgi:hypothetical protein
MHSKDREGPTKGEVGRSFGNRILRTGTGPVLAPRPELRPTPGRFYQIKSGDNLLEVAGHAYGVKAGAQRLEFAKLINNANYNCRFWREAPEGEKKWFPQGRVSFSTRFDCDLRNQVEAKDAAPSGNCFAMIWIPPREGGEPF